MNNKSLQKLIKKKIVLSGGAGCRPDGARWQWYWGMKVGKKYKSRAGLGV